MNEYLLRHAISTVWCNPSMDRQHVYQLVRLSPRYGVHGAYTVDHERYRLPTERDYYHIYQIGKVEPKLLGLPKRLSTWMSLKDLSNETSLYAELYLNNGIQFPRFDVHLLLTPAKNLIIAVKDNSRIHSLDKQDVYLRFYNNAYFDSERSNQANRRSVFVMGGIAGTTQAVVDMQIQMAQEFQVRGGVPYYFVNGRFSNTLTLMNCSPGDAMEMVIDESVEHYIDFELNQLPSFLSTLDAENKFLLHYNDPSVQSIRFYDDLDVFLYKPVPDSDRLLGVTYHRNEGNWLRQLTHKDYSVSVERLNSFVTVHPTDPRAILDSVKYTSDQWNNLSELKLRVYFRQSGYDRPLQAEASRIHELYRLTDSQVLGALTGVDSTLDIWKAANLEQSAYVRFMGAKASKVNPIGLMDPTVTGPEKQAAQEFAGEVFGYHAAASILAKTPTDVYDAGGVQQADLAYSHWYNATVYEFSAEGHLLGHHHHVAGRRYAIRDPRCVRVEAIIGKGGDNLNSVYGKNSVTLDLEYNYRLYVVRVRGGVHQGGWVDITDETDRSEWGFLETTNGITRWVWTYDETKWYGCVRQDNRFLNYGLTLAKSSGVMRFSVGSYETHQGLTDYKLLEVPFGQLDLFLLDDNGVGRPLIENLDYVVQWPEVVICNLEYLNPGAVQRVLVRGYGFCEEDLTRPTASEYGFIEYGVLSNDATYDIHTHKVQRVVVDGHYRDPADLHFEEQWGDLTITDERNGAPYCIQTPPVVFKDVYMFDHHARKADDLKDKAVSAYMGRLYPKRPRPQIDTIVEQYHVVSVFANKLLHDLRSGQLQLPGIMDHYSDADLRIWLKGYEWLLPYDLCNRTYNENHVQVWPHWYGEAVGLPIERYNFYKRALKVYLQQVPDVSVFVYVDAGILT